MPIRLHPLPRRSFENIAYLQVTDEHWSKAVAPVVAPIRNPTGPIPRNDESKKPCDLPGSDGDWGGSDDPENRPSRARTYDLRIRNPLLCPTEL